MGSLPTRDIAPLAISERSVITDLRRCTGNRLPQCGMRRSRKRFWSLCWKRRLQKLLLVTKKKSSRPFQRDSKNQYKKSCHPEQSEGPLLDRKCWPGIGVLAVLGMTA